MLYNNKLLLESPHVCFMLTIGVISCFIINLLYKVNTIYVLSLFTILFIFLLYFYRDPNINNVKFKDNYVVAPSYGQIIKINHNMSTNTIHMCIFLSPFDVHQQYYPVNGTVIDRIYDKTGQFNLAFDLDKSRFNEKKIHILQNKYGTFIITQIAGRLVHCIVSEEDTNVHVNTGTRFGMIKFGSRVDIEIPNATNFKLLVNENDYLVGGYQTIGYYIRG